MRTAWLRIEHGFVEDAEFFPQVAAALNARGVQVMRSGGRVALSGDALPAESEGDKPVRTLVGLFEGQPDGSYNLLGLRLRTDQRSMSRASL